MHVPTQKWVVITDRFLHTWPTSRESLARPSCLWLLQVCWLVWLNSFHFHMSQLSNSVAMLRDKVKFLDKDMKTMPNAFKLTAFCTSCLMWSRHVCSRTCRQQTEKKTHAHIIKYRDYIHLYLYWVFLCIYVAFTVTDCFYSNIILDLTALWSIVCVFAAALM